MKHIFIINPYLSNMCDAGKIREKLAKRDNFEYLVFNTEYAGHEKALVEQMVDLFKDETIRFYCCGGSGTLFHMLNGISDFDKAEIAFMPCGISCDFLKVFGERRRFFYNIDSLIEGEILPMDLIDTGVVKALNTFVTGLGVRGAGLGLKLGGTLDFFKHLSYFGSGIASILLDRSRNYEITIDGKDFSGKYKQIYVGNGCCLGSKYYPIPSAKPNDGKLNFLLLKDLSRPKMVKALKHYRSGDIEELSKYCLITEGKTFTIKNLSGEKMIFNCDGEFEECNDIDGKIMQGKLKFIVPKGIAI